LACAEGTPHPHQKKVKMTRNTRGSSTQSSRPFIEGRAARGETGLMGIKEFEKRPGKAGGTERFQEKGIFFQHDCIGRKKGKIKESNG